MAPSGGLYLPDLGKCLQGDEPVISWEDLLRTLLSHKYDHQSSIVSFFGDPRVLDLLSQAYPSLPPASSQAKSSFETRTAAINVSPSTSGTYDIEEIKSDALWLSSEADIDQVEALRLVVLEWQQRPELCMLQGFSDAEFASLRDALGIETLQSLGFVPESRYYRHEEKFDCKDGRYLRIASQFLVDQVRMLAVSRTTLEQAIRQSIDVSSESVLTATMKQIDESIAAPNSALSEVQMCVEFVKTAMDRLSNPHQWQVSEEFLVDLDECGTTSLLQSIAIAFQIVLLRLRRSTLPTSVESLLPWLQFLASVEYFVGFQSDIPSQRTAISQIQSAASYVTLVLLDSSSMMSAMSDTEYASPTKLQDYFTDYDDFTEIHDYMLSAAGTCNVYASPGFLAWGLVLLEIRRSASLMREARESHHVQKAIDMAASQDNSAGRRSSTSSASSGQQSIYEDLLERTTSSNFTEDVPSYMINCALEGCNVLGLMTQMSAEAQRPDSVLASFQLQILQDLIAVSIPVLGYSTDILSTQLALLTPLATSKHTRAMIYEPAVAFIEDQFLMNSFFNTAAARFPYETLPFLRLCRSLAQANVFDEDGTQYITFRLRRLDSFTQAASNGFSSYHTIREDENANLVSLQHAVGMLDSMGNEPSTYADQHAHMVDIIPSQTMGEVISESLPPIIKWQHEFSGLALVGKWLELHYRGVLTLSMSPAEAAHDVVAEVITLLATLLKTTFERGSNSQEARQACELILSEASNLLDEHTDCAVCIFELLERELQTFRRCPPAVYDTGILVACVEFSIVLSKIRPSQCWAQIRASSLFGIGGSSGSLLAVVAAVEVPRQHFEFLGSCSKLYNTLVDLALQQVLHNVQYHKQSSGAVSRTNQARATETAFLNYTATMFSVMEAISSWSFLNPTERSGITTNIAGAFSHVLQSSFGTEDLRPSNAGALSIYRPAARFLLESLKMVNSPEGKANTVILNLATSFTPQKKETIFGEQDPEDAPVILSLAVLLVRHGLLVKEPIGPFEKQLLDFFPVLVRLPLSFRDNHYQCYTLLRDTLKSMTGDPMSSLLGRLGSVSAIAFINHLKLAVSNPSTSDVTPQTWQLLSLLVSHEQQWLAIVLITGKPPRLGENTKQTISPTVRGVPILNVALKYLVNIVNIDPNLAIGILSFIVQAQLNWISVTDTLDSEQDFFPALINYVARQRTNAQNETENSLHNSVASLITAVATAHLHHLVGSRNATSIKIFLPLFTWLTSNAIEVSSFNTSLHKNLKKNISNKYGGFDITELKRTNLVEARYGEEYFYDVDVATQLLGTDPHWNNNDLSKHSFSSELKRANANLSLVDSEFRMLNSFKHMCLDHRFFFSQDRDIQKTMAHVVTNSLRANMQISSTDTIFENLAQTRLDLAVALIRQLILSGAKGSDFVLLLNTVWTAARVRNGSYELAIMNDDLKYWRSMLSVLLMSLRLHAEKKLKSFDNKNQSGITSTQTDPINATILEIASEVVGKGMRSVVTALHSQMQRKSRSSALEDILVGARDVYLLLNIFQTILRLPAINQISSQLAECLISSGIVNSCLLLYSWAHILTDTDGREPPVYADASLRFLVSISSLSTAAEEIAIEGTLSRLLSARTMQILQDSSQRISPRETRSITGLSNTLWNNGLLPLCLNLLYAVGGGVASEISTFLNQFPTQLTRATMAFATTPQGRESGGDILTLAAANEAATLSLIAYILDSYRKAGASAGIDSVAIMSLSNFDEHRKIMAEDIRDVIQQKQQDRKKRTLAMNEEEMIWQKSVDNLLDNKIVTQLQQALACLSQEEEEEQS